MTISPLSAEQIFAVIQQLIAVRISKSPPMPLTAAPDTTRNGAEIGPNTKRTMPIGLTRLIAQRVGALRPEDPQRRRKAFRIFLESVLINLLGENLINDPAFSQMLEDIQVQMESDPGIAIAMHEASAQLLSGATPNGWRQPLTPVTK